MLSFEGHKDSYVALENNGKLNLQQHRNNIVWFKHVRTIIFQQYLLYSVNLDEYCMDCNVIVRVTLMR